MKWSEISLRDSQQCAFSGKEGTVEYDSITKSYYLQFSSDLVASIVYEVHLTFSSDID